VRVTENMNFDLSRETMSKSRAKMGRLQEQAATTRRLTTPADDPVGATKVLEIRTDRMNAEQFITNAKLAENFLGNSEAALAEVGDILVRAKEIALGQSSGASANPQTRIAVAEEVTQLYQQAIAAANRRIGDRYLFGGYKTTQPPFDPDGRYRGDEGQMMVEISKDVFLGMNVPGQDAFNTRPQVAKARQQEQDALQGQNRGPASSGGASAENLNVFEELQALRIGLLSGNSELIQSTLDGLDALHGKVTSVRSMLGSRMQGLSSATQSQERQVVLGATLSSTLEDADMAQVMSDLAREETVFRGALASSQKLIQPTLLDFLK
jgi:flagellar hook-associated protein 3 FlgL